MDDLYDTDILEWAEQQAAVLRSLRARRDLPNDLDLEHVAEEIEDVGRSELRTAQSLIRQILAHLIKAVSVPPSDAMKHWHSEAITFHSDLLDCISAAMVNRIDLQKLWQRAKGEVDTHLKLHGQSVASDLPRDCPLGIDDIVGQEFDFSAAVSNLLAQMHEAK